MIFYAVLATLVVLAALVLIEQYIVDAFGPAPGERPATPQPQTADWGPPPEGIQWGRCPGCRGRSLIFTAPRQLACLACSETPVWGEELYDCRTEGCDALVPGRDMLRQGARCFFHHWQAKARARRLRAGAS